MKYKLILSIVALVLLIGIVDANKENIVSLLGYEEECLEYYYHQIPYFEHQCKIHSFTGPHWVDCFPDQFGYSLEPERDIVKMRTVKGDCKVYHLVRYTEKGGEGKENEIK